MSQKAARRDAAIKKAKAKRKIMITVGILAAVIVIGALIMISLQNNDRVFTAAGNQIITLYEDGSFTASLPHGISKEGMYMEQFEDDMSFILFFLEDRIEVGTLYGNILTPPIEWDDGHGHDREFILN